MIIWIENNWKDIVAGLILLLSFFTFWKSRKKEQKDNSQLASDKRSVLHEKINMLKENILRHENEDLQLHEDLKEECIKIIDEKYVYFMERQTAGYETKHKEALVPIQNDINSIKIDIKKQGLDIESLSCNVNRMIETFNANTLAQNKFSDCFTQWITMSTRQEENNELTNNKLVNVNSRLQETNDKIYKILIYLIKDEEKIKEILKP
jgi:hypothetical protein